MKPDRAEGDFPVVGTARPESGLDRHFGHHAVIGGHLYDLVEPRGLIVLLSCPRINLLVVGFVITV